MDIRNKLLALLLACMICTGSDVSGKTEIKSIDLTRSSHIHPNNWPFQRSPLTRKSINEIKIKNLLHTMSLEEKVGQVIQADIDSVTPEQAKKYHLGAILNGGNSAPNNNNRASPLEWLELADKFWLRSTDKSNGNSGIPIMWGTDAVHGHSNIIGATIFPHNIGLGSANDSSLIKKIGFVTATEMLVTGVDWTFAPTIAVARDDRWGRTYESYSEDPDLVERYASKIIEGIQGKVGTDEYLDDNHLLATAKHFIGDGGTQKGKDQGNNLTSEAELRDIHGKAYLSAIDAGVIVVMASFSSWQGNRLHGYQALLNDVLIERLGFDGMVVGDWNGHALVKNCKPDSCPQSINAGVDMFMAPDSWKDLYYNTLQDVKRGVISLDRLNDAVGKVLRTKLRMGLFDAGLPSSRKLAGKFNLLGSKKHQSIAREAVRKSLVLLKNNGQLLPLSPNSHILITGDGADNIAKQSGGWTLSWQGTGNTNKDFPNGRSIYQGLANAMQAKKGTIEYSENGEFMNKPDVAIVVFGEDPYAEFLGDKNNLSFGDERGLNLLSKLKKQGIKTVSIFLSGRPLWLNREINLSDAFVAAWLPGTEGGGIADVLLANNDGSINYNFSGKLSFSWPNTAVDTSLNIGDENYEPLFPFGYGLN